LLSDTEELTGISSGKWYQSCLQSLELLDVNANGRQLGFTFFIGRMTEVLATDIYGAHCSLFGNHNKTNLAFLSISAHFMYKTKILIYLNGHYLDDNIMALLSHKRSKRSRDQFEII
jgi:hypothetical protein